MRCDKPDRCGRGYAVNRGLGARALLAANSSPLGRRTRRASRRTRSHRGSSRTSRSHMCVIAPRIYPSPTISARALLRGVVPDARAFARCWVRRDGHPGSRHAPLMLLLVGIQHRRGQRPGPPASLPSLFCVEVARSPVAVPIRQHHLMNARFEAALHVGEPSVVGRDILPPQRA